MIRRILKIGLMAGAFFIFAGLIAYLTVSFFVRSQPSTVVPDLVGKHVVAALELLSDLSLNTKVGGMEYNSNVPIHHVISQDPPPGTEIKPGRDVRITLSKGPETVVVPSLNGFTMEQARIVLEENGLSSGNIAHVYQAQIPEGVVLAHFPSPGKTIHRDRPVDLLVSLGRRPTDFLMPDLSGLSIDEAMQRIEKVNLSLDKVNGVSIKDRPLDTIISQSPAPGHRVIEKDAVSLTINRKTAADGKSAAFRNGLLLLRHSLEPGFLNRHIRVRLNCFGLSMDLVDTFLKPGKQLWCLIPMESDSTAFLYEDDVLIKSEVFE